MSHALIRDDLAAIAPHFANLTKDILFDDIWQRDDLMMITLTFGQPEDGSSASGVPFNWPLENRL